MFQGCNLVVDALPFVESCQDEAKIMGRVSQWETQVWWESWNRSFVFIIVRSFVFINVWLKVSAETFSVHVFVIDTNAQYSHNCHQLIPLTFGWAHTGNQEKAKDCVFGTCDCKPEVIASLFWLLFLFQKKWLQLLFLLRVSLKIYTLTPFYTPKTWRQCEEKALLQLFCLQPNTVGWSGHMTSSWSITCLVDHDVCNLCPESNGRVLSWFQCWQVVSGFLFASYEL